MLAVLVALPALAQNAPEYWVNPNYTVRQWTVLDGLPSNTINSFTQTSDGYLWMGTNEGLVRFDGNTFTTFNATNTPELASNRIARLQEGPEGYLWVVTDQGDLALYQAGRFTRFEVKFEGMYAERDTVWFGTKRGVWRYAEGRLEHYRQDVIDTPVTAIVRDRAGRLWVGTSKQGLYRLDPTGAVKHFDLGNCWHLLLDQQDRVWAALWQNLVLIEGDRVETIHRDGFFFPDYVDAEGNVWIVSDEEGWWRHAPSGARTLIPKPQAIARADRVSEGPEGHQWRMVSIGDSGVLDEHLLYRDEELIFRVRDEITYTFDRRGTLWIGTQRNGLFRLQRSFLHTVAEAEGLPHRAVYPVLEDRAGQIWIGTFGRGLVRFDGAMQPTVFLPKVSGVLQYMLALYEDRKGTIWVGGIGFTCTMQGDQCRSDDLPERVHVNARAMHEDRQGRFWIAGQEGLIVGEDTGNARTWTRVASADSLL